MDERHRRLLASRTSLRRLLVIPEPYVVAPSCHLQPSPAPPRPRAPWSERSRGRLLTLVRAPPAVSSWLENARAAVIEGEHTNKNMIINDVFMNC